MPARVKRPNGAPPNGDLSQLVSFACKCPDGCRRNGAPHNAPAKIGPWPLRCRFGRRHSPRHLIPFRRLFVTPSSAKWMRWAHDYTVFRTSDSKAAPNSSCESAITGCFTNSTSSKAASICPQQFRRGIGRAWPLRRQSIQAGLQDNRQSIRGFLRFPRATTLESLLRFL
jgi:hypothetical protein